MESEPADAARLERIADDLEASVGASEQERSALRTRVIREVLDLSEATVQASVVLARWAWRRDQDPLDSPQAADDFRALAAWLRKQGT